MIEIERKFLVTNTDWGAPETTHRIEQGYMFIEEDRNMRIRRSGDIYTTALKVSIDPLTRYEFETEIEPEHGLLMLSKLCVSQPVRKTRHLISFKGMAWEVDVFHDSNAGLIVAEIELSATDEHFETPPWVGPEVSADKRFANAALSKTPFRDWGLTYQELVSQKSAPVTQ
jgi:adenylate cyclase